jgi:hypothetical protein
VDIVSTSTPREPIPQQLIEYTARGKALLTWNLYDFLISSYEGPDRANPLQMCVAYRESTPLSGRFRVLRTSGHEVLLQFMDGFFPNSRTNFELYCASVLILFEAWHTVRDLKQNSPSFEAAYHQFMMTASPSVVATLQNLQYFHDSRVAMDI